MSTPDPRKLAEKIIRSAVEDIEFGDIGDMAEEHYDHLGEAAYDKFCLEVDDLIRKKAVVTVTWTGEATADADDFEAYKQRVLDATPPKKFIEFNI